MKVSNKNKIFGQDNSVDVLIIACAVVALFVSIYYFSSGIRRESQPDGKVAGKIRYTSASARIRAAQDLVWNPIRHLDSVHQKDYVVAGKDSEVIIELTGRGILRVSPGSMIQVTTFRDKGPSINILKGSVGFKAKSTQPLNFRIADKDVGLELTDGRISVTEKNKDVQIAVYAGKAVLEDGTTLESQSLLNLGENKTKEILDVSFVFPENDEFTYLENTQVRFQISTVPKAGGFLWMSRDDTFQDKDVLPWPSNATELLVPFKTDGKIYYKFVDAEGNDDSLTYTHSFQRWSPPTIVTPVTGTIVRSPVSFSWSHEHRLPFDNHLQVSSDEQFKNIVSELTTDDDSIDVKLSAGRYYWRVGVKEAGLSKPWSSVGRFRLIEAATENLQLKSLKNRYPLIQGVAQVDLEILGESAGTKLYLMISEGGNEAKRLPLPSRQYRAQFTQAGNYKLQVIDLDAENVEVGISSPLEIIVEPHKSLPPPRLRNEDYEVEFEDLSTFFHRATRVFAAIWNRLIPVAEARSSSPLLEWDRVEEAQEYIVEIYSDRERSTKITEFRTKALEQSWKPKTSGVFYWRVTAVDEFGIRGVPSPLGRISFLPKFSNLPGPQIERGLFSENKLQMELLPIDRAETYEIDVKVVGESNQVLQEKKFEVDELNIQEEVVLPLDAKAILIQARGVSTNKRNVTRATDFKIDVVKPENRVGTSMNSSDRLWSLSYQRFGMGSKWNEATEDLKDVSGDSKMNFISLRFFRDRRWKLGPGIDFFNILDGSIELQGLALSFQSSYTVWQEGAFKVEPLMGFFSTPYHKQGLYGARLEVPIHYQLLPTLGFFLGAGYVYGKFYGVEKVQNQVDLNVPFSNVSAFIGLIYSGL